MSESYSTFDLLNKHTQSLPNIQKYKPGIAEPTPVSEIINRNYRKVFG